MKKASGIRYVAWVLTGLLVVTLFTGCISVIKETAEEKKSSDILNTQKALIVSLLNRGMASMALKELKKNIKDHPEDVDFRNLMGLTQLALGNAKQSIPFFQSAYQIEPKIPVGLNLSSALIEVGKYQEAIKLLLVLKTGPEAESYPYPERIDHNIGLAYEKREKPALALKHYNEALSSNPNFYISILRAAQLHQKLNSREKSQELYLKAHGACPVCFEPVSGLVASYIVDNKVDKAMEILQTYLKVPGVSPKDRARAKTQLKTANNTKKTTQTTR